uniref:RING-type E3 ubiquitin transferase n=1 Tax=Sinocyclocheilus anshuiensis TaxID=1608454 RepID=A0A671QC93_9TELE
MAQLNEVDLPPNLSCLKSIDTLLRCPICFEFLNITMMTQCSHNFCSLCIRKFLSYKLLCPVCNSPSTEQDLRNNRLLDDLVQSFQAARQKLCHSNLESPPISPETPVMMIKGKAARRKGLRKEANTLSHFFQKKTPVIPSSEAQTSLKLHVPVKSEPMELCLQQLGNVKHENVEDTMGMVKDEKMDVTAFPSTSHNKPLVKVECPVCGVGVPEQHINKHLDMCLSRDKEGLRRYGEYLSHNTILSYFMYLGIFICWLMFLLFHLLTAEKIAKEVENNERLKNQMESKRKPVIVTTKNQTAEEIEELHSMYRKQHSSEFSRLIAQVRGRLETSKRAPVKQEEEKSAEETDSKGSPNSIQNTPQPLVSAMLEVKSEEMDGVIELPSRSSTPTISEVSVSRYFCLKANHFHPCIWNNFRW